MKAFKENKTEIDQKINEKSLFKVSDPKMTLVNRKIFFLQIRLSYSYKDSISRIIRVTSLVVLLLFCNPKFPMSNQILYLKPDYQLSKTNCSRVIE